MLVDVPAAEVSRVMTEEYRAAARAEYIGERPRPAPVSTLPSRETRERLRAERKRRRKAGRR